MSAFLKVLISSLFITCMHSISFAQISPKGGREWSLFNEEFKNKLFVEALPNGLKVIEVSPSSWNTFNIYKKLEKCFTEIIDSNLVGPERIAILKDSLLNFYDIAIKNDPQNTSYYYIKKGYAYQVYFKVVDPEKAINAFIKARDADSNMLSENIDRLGLVYKKYMDDSKNNYKTKALQLYLELSEKEPTNSTWPERMKSLAANKEQYVGLVKSVWYLSKDDVGKAYQYSKACLSIQAYEKALEPLLFLTKKEPTTLNYWNDLAKVYQKLGKTEEQIDIYKKLIKLDPKNNGHQINVAIMYKGLNQYSVARNYLIEAMKINPEDAHAIYLEASLYEDAARNTKKYDFMDKCVYKLAADTYAKAAQKSGEFATQALERSKVFETIIPNTQDYWLEKINYGDKINITGGSYNWINRTIVRPSK